jgi:peptidoglycan-N-acetylglucosamine deacetylase
MLTSRTTNFIFLTILFILIVVDVFLNVSVWMYLVVGIGYTALQAYGSTVLSAQFFVPVKFRSSESSKMIALTFDDGPLAGKTDAILDILKTYKIPATFFCIGNRVKTNPEIVERMVREGHVIGNHSYWHGKTFDLQSSSIILKELRDTDDLIFDVVGSRPRFFRPPYGVTNPMVASAIRQGNYSTIGWSVRSFDTMIKDAAQLFKRVSSAVKPGDIIVFHDFSESTVKMLPQIVEHVLSRGLKLVTVDELINERPYV